MPEYGFTLIRIFPHEDRINNKIGHNTGKYGSKKTRILAYLGSERELKAMHCFSQNCLWFNQASRI